MKPVYMLCLTENLAFFQDKTRSFSSITI